MRCSVRWIFILSMLAIWLVAGRLHEAQLPTPVAARPATSNTADFRVPVLMYHRINDDALNSSSPLLRDLTVPVADFEAQIRYLVEHEFTLLSAGDVEEAVRLRRPLPEKAVVVTMDDGYKDNFDYASPILRRFRAPATIFLVTSTVGSVGHLTWDDVLLMKRERVSYGSHTVTHPDLTILPVARLDYELRESKREIEVRTVERVSSIAYPAGQYNDLVRERARAAGYTAGWKKGGGPVGPDCDPLLMPRLRVHGRTTMSDFARKVHSGIELIRQARARKA